jgi:hypothetical protein
LAGEDLVVGQFQLFGDNTKTRATNQPSELPITNTLGCDQSSDRRRQTAALVQR